MASKISAIFLVLCVVGALGANVRTKRGLFDPSTGGTGPLLDGSSFVNIFSLLATFPQLLLKLLALPISVVTVILELLPQIITIGVQLGMAPVNMLQLIFSSGFGVSDMMSFIKLIIPSPTSEQLGLLNILPGMLEIFLGLFPLGYLPFAFS